MKKFLLIAGGAVIMAAASVWGYSYHQEQTMDPWLKANIAALSSAEDLEQGESHTTRSGRARTVGCGSVSMHDWKQYCCPDVNYHNCPKTNPSNYCNSSPIYGCNDGPLRPL